MRLSRIKMQKLKLTKRLKRRWQIPIRLRSQSLLILSKVKIDTLGRTQLLYIVLYIDSDDGNYEVYLKVGSLKQELPGS